MEGETIEHVRLTCPKVSGDGDIVQVETDLGGLNGIRSVRANADSHEIEVAFDPREVGVDKIREVLQADGFDVESVQYASERDDTALDTTQA